MAEQDNQQQAQGAQNADRVDLDLDVLAKPSKNVRLNGKVVEVRPLEVGELFRLHRLGKDFQQVDTDNMTEEQATEAFKALHDGFTEFIPDLKGQTLSIDQLFALLDLVINMAMPSDIEELEKRGITLSADQKKILSQYSKKSANS